MLFQPKSFMKIGHCSKEKIKFPPGFEETVTHELSKTEQTYLLTLPPLPIFYLLHISETFSFTMQTHNKPKLCNLIFVDNFSLIFPN